MKVIANERRRMYHIVTKENPDWIQTKCNLRIHSDRIQLLNKRGIIVATYPRKTFGPIEEKPDSDLQKRWYELDFWYCRLCNPERVSRRNNLRPEGETE